MRLFISTILAVGVLFGNAAHAEELNLGTVELEKHIGSLSLTDSLEAPQSRNNTRSLAASYIRGIADLTDLQPLPGRGVKLTCTAPRAVEFEFIVEAVTNKLILMHTAQGSWAANKRKSKFRNGQFKKVVVKALLSGRGKTASKQSFVFSRFTPYSANFTTVIRNYVGGKGAQRSYCVYKFRGTLGLGNLN